MADLALAFDVLTRDQGASAGMDRIAASVERASRAGSFFGSVIGTVVGNALFGLAAGVGAAARGLENLVKGGFGELFAYDKGLSQLNAGIASTGGIAGVSATEMEKLAGAIQSYSGQTDDSIVASEQLLLTFTNIRNQVGAGNDIFNQATKATADLAARMGGDASGAAIQLGKALNDPVKGITALTRIGVSFTDGQKKLIGELVNSGRVMEAQKVILAELNREFGGSAKAYGQTLPGEIARSKRAFEDLSQSIAAALAPTVNKYLPGIIKGIQDATPKIEATVERIAPIVGRALKDAFEFVRGSISEFVQVAGPALDQLAQAAQRFFGGIAGIFDRTNTSVRGVGAAFGESNGQLVKLAADGLTKVLNGLDKIVPIFLRVTALEEYAAAAFISFARTMLAELVPLLRASGSVASALGFDGIGKKLQNAATSIQNFGKDAQANLTQLASDSLAAASSFEDAVQRITFAQVHAEQLTRDANSDNPNVAKRAQQQIADAAKKNLPKPDVAKKAGQDYSVSLAKGLDDGRKALVAAAQKNVEAIRAVFEKAKAGLQSLVQQSMSLRQNVTQALQNGARLTDIFSGPDLNANNAFGPQRRFGQVRDFLTKRLAQEKKFVAELHQLMKEGLDPSLVAQIASAGVDGGQRIAEAILSGGRGGVGQVNGIERQIASIANIAGKSVADLRFAKQIAEARKNTEYLGHKLDQQTAILTRLQNPPKSTAKAQATAAALRSA